nr:hypothetical protein [Tanacetum cinerariifolium]
MSFVSAVPGQMIHFVSSLTLDSAKSSVMHGASCTQRKVSMVPFVLSIPFVLSQVVVVAIIGVIIVVAIIGVVVVVGVSAIIKLSFVIIG